MNNKVRVIAFYLPQFHPFKENDEWWGKGFTEWHNVTKAKPLFKGHYQPKLPADLGFYDLRVPETREQQAELARQAGIEGFCYWHYWFNGHELMERPFWEVVKSGKPDFPFCIGWANETWKSKMWNKDGSLAEGTKILIEQTYSEEDDIAHFKKLLPVFRDKRYILVDGKPLVFVHDGLALPDRTIKIWNKMASDNGFPGIHFVGRLTGHTMETIDEGISQLLAKGYDAVKVPRLALRFNDVSFVKKLWRKIGQFVRYNGCTHVVRYEEEIKGHVIPRIDVKENVYPVLYPNWDHSPRSGKSKLIVIDSKPELFKGLAEKIIDEVKGKDLQHRIIFIKSWNEWGEGNYMEPDTKYGDGYIRALQDVLKG